MTEERATRRTRTAEAEAETPAVETPKTPKLSKYEVASGCGITDHTGTKRKGGEAIELTSKVAKVLAQHGQIVPFIPDDEE